MHRGEDPNESDPLIDATSHGTLYWYTRAPVGRAKPLIGKDGRGLDGASLTRHHFPVTRHRVAGPSTLRMVAGCAPLRRRY